MPADFDPLTCGVEGPHASDLLSNWKEITKTLVAELYQELDRRAGHGNAARGHASVSAHRRQEGPCHRAALPDGSQLVANDAEIDRSNDDFANTSDDTWPSYLDESENETDIYDELVVPFHLIDEAADLSQYEHSTSPLSFEELFAQDCPLPQYDTQFAEREGTPHRVESDATTSSGSPLSPLTSPSELKQNQMIDPDSVSERDALLGAARGKGAIEETEPIALPPASLPRHRRCSRKTPGLRVSDKKNLTLVEINVVADILISQDAISDFLCHCHSIYESWMPYLARPRLDSRGNIEASAVTAFDTVQNLLDGNRICRVLLRFACFQLTRVIDAYKAVVADDRVQNKARRPVGNGDATVAINLYLEEKRKVSGVALKRSRLLGHCRTGRRWAVLAVRAPLLILIFPHIADTIVYVPFHPPLVETHDFQRQNNAIRDSTIQALAARMSRVLV
ncbi:hypothetical protein LTS13_008088 [Exophiala xenobiotica]|nr:hypothetical protein LTS13_008088 [Exophiala xenobiotica]